MRRRWAGALAVVALLVLAGCHGGLRYSADPTVRVEGPADGTDGYRVTLGARAGTSSDDATFRNVSVRGYATDGTEVCAAELGTLDAAGTLDFDPLSTPEYAERTVRCDDLPAIVTVGVRNLSEGPGPIDSPVVVYLGQRADGTHVYESFPRRIRPGDDGAGNETGGPDSEGVLPPRPDRTTLAFAKCRQFAVRDGDRDFSALGGDHPWTAGDPAPPSTRTRIQLIVEPLDHLDPADYPDRDRATLPPLVREAMETATDDDEFRRNVSVSTFLSLHEALLDREVASLDDLPDDGDEGRDVEDYDTRGIDCWQRAYDGEDHHETRYEFAVDGTVWQVELVYAVSWYGAVDVPTVPAGMEGRPENTSQSRAVDAGGGV